MKRPISEKVHLVSINYKHALHFRYYSQDHKTESSLVDKYLPFINITGTTCPSSSNNNQVCGGTSQGTCSNGVCVCKPGYTGTSCDERGKIPTRFAKLLTKIRPLVHNLIILSNSFVFYY